MKRIFRIFLWVIVGCIFVSTFVFLYINSRPEKMEYEIVSPTIGDIEKQTVLTGKIEPRDEIEIKPQISGIITEISVEPGEMVKEGDIIAKIKVIPEASSLSSAQLRVETAEISLADATSKYERNKILYEKKIISREEFETSETSWRQAQQELDAAKDAYLIVKEGVSKYNATESNTLVRATIDGLVLDVPVKVGSSVIQSNTFNDGTTIATIADMNKLIFKGKVDETEVGELRVGMPMEITIGALPGRHPMAILEYISPKGTEENGANTFEIKGAMNIDSISDLRAGYSANATVTLSRAEHVIMLPEGVVTFSGDSTYVYLLKSGEGVNRVFEKHPIVTGMSDGINIEIKEGLDTISKVRG
ncbi:MAG: efflux RND transporter periplasmic adaptor subunit [Muribaculaceae bacterium]|nr:efflux RND transporter periplasmic adaptor subunit [Muribaculaceae bacterium]